MSIITRHRRGRPSSRLFPVLAFLALLFNIIVPPGTMAATDGAGSTRIILCTGQGPVEMVVSLDGQAAPASDDLPDRHDGFCPFAAHAAACIQSEAYPADVQLAFAGRDPVSPVRLALASGRSMAAPPPPSRGPPAVQL